MKKRARILFCVALAFFGCTKTITPEISLSERTAVLSPDGATAVTEVTCNCNWTATSDLETVTIDPPEADGDASVRITVPANNTGAIRTLRVTFSAKGTEKTATAKYVITQDAQPYLSFPTATGTIGAAGGGLRVVLESNGEWTTTVSDTGITVDPASNSYTQTLALTVPANTTGAPIVHTVMASLVKDASVKSTYTLTQSN